MYNELKYIKSHPKGRIPKKATLGSCGFDLYSCENKIIPASKVYKDNINIGHSTVNTGIIIEFPDNLIGRIGSRSGISIKDNIEVGAGWIDSDYRGEIQIELKNFSDKPFRIKTGDRIAQLIILKKEEVIFKKAEKISKTIRNKKGFGSTGK